MRYGVWCHEGHRSKNGLTRELRKDVCGRSGVISLKNKREGGKDDSGWRGYLKQAATAGTLLQ